MIFFLALTIYAYIRFKKLRYKYVFAFVVLLYYLYLHSRQFTIEWWTWLTLTGVFMACTWGSKVNGILAVFAIGIAVLIDLWDILDIDKGNSMVG
jgi:dolichyl-phosphate-mannose-protein mannosyltransferase